MSVLLPVDIASPAQLSELIGELHTYRNQLRNAAVQAKVKKTPLIETELSDELANLLHNNKIDAIDSQQLDTLHKELQKTLTTAPVMHLTFAANPGRTLRRQLTVWFRTQIEPTSLLTFAMRSDIGGGMLLQAGSHFYDYSFRDRILANKSRLMEIANV